MSGCADIYKSFYTHVQAVKGVDVAAQVSSCSDEMARRVVPPKSLQVTTLDGAQFSQVLAHYSNKKKTVTVLRRTGPC